MLVAPAGLYLKALTRKPNLKTILALNKFHFLGVYYFLSN